MKVFCKKLVGIAMLLFFFQVESFGQLDLRNYEIGASLGSFIYQGDLTPSRLGSYRTATFNFNLFVNRVLNPSFSLRTNLAFGKLRGDDAKYANPEWRQQRNFIFSSSVSELSELLVWNVLPTDGKISPYVFAGAGLSFLNIKRDWSLLNTAYFPNLADRLKTDATYTPPKTIGVLPVGMGLQMSLNNKLSLMAETNYRFTKTDYLDGFSQAANPSSKDSYFSHTIGLVYKFGKRSNYGCPGSVQ